MTTLDPKVTAVFAAFLLCIVSFFARRRLVDLTCTGVFYCSYLIFVTIGILLSPWLIEGYLQDSFSYIHWEFISPQNLTRAITTIMIGLLCFIAGNCVADTLPGRFATRWLALLHPPASAPPLGANLFPLLLFYLSLVFFAAVLLSSKISLVATGFYEGYIRLDHGAYYRTREAVQQLGLPYYLVIFNALPFCSQILFLSFRMSPKGAYRNRAFIWLLPPALFLVLTFEKTALILFVILSGAVLMLARIYSGRVKLHLGNRFSIRLLWRNLGSFRRHLWLPFTVALATLLTLYTLTTDSIVEQGSGAAVVGKALTVVVDRICLRLSVMPLMYTHYFPDVDSFYGFSNVGRLAAISGTEYYADTQNVLRYFTGLQEGGGAIGSLTDFYAGFGWGGLIVGSFLLGLFMRFLDRILRSLPFTILNRVLWIFLLYISWYLSQANIFRCLSTYGGGVFATLWLILNYNRLSPFGRHVR
jgi:hypothetical protein